MESAKGRWETERQSGEVESRSRQADLEQLAADLESERHRLGQVLEDLVAREEELGRGTVSGGAGLDESESAQAVRADLDRQREEMARTREELDSLREAIGKEREAVEGDRERCELLAAEIEEQRIESERQSGVVAQEAAELRVEREAFSREQEKWEAAQLDAQKQIEERAEQLDRQIEMLDAQKEELAIGQSNWEGVQAEAEAKLAARAEQLDAREHELDERTKEYERVPQPASGGLDFFGDSDAPVSSANSGDLFRQMEGDLTSRTQPLSEFSELRGVERDDEFESVESDPEASDPESMIVMREEEESGNTQRTVSEILLDDPVIADSFVSQSYEEPALASRPAAPMACDDEEQSIEQYMAGVACQSESRGRCDSGSARSQGASRARADG